jgi:hypothetical protein
VPEWFFTKTYTRGDKPTWKGPYRSEASATLMIARELKKEIKRRHQSWAGTA